MRTPRHARFWSAGSALVVLAAMLGAFGHGLAAQAVNTLEGDAWLYNAVNSSVSLVNG